jgi:hypothetical protein
LTPLLSWLPVAIFMASMAAQWGAADVALTNGEAMATPRKSANHTSTKRVIRWALRRDCMERLLITDGVPEIPHTRYFLVHWVK